MQHIQFRLDEEGGVWRPVAREGSALGLATIDALELDRDALCDLYTRHAEDWRSELRALAASAEDGDRGFPERWRRSVRRLLDPRQMFCGLNHDLLDAAVPVPLRARLCVQLPLPGAGVPDGPAG